MRTHLPFAVVSLLAAAPVWAQAPADAPAEVTPVVVVTPAPVVIVTDGKAMPVPKVAPWLHADYALLAAGAKTTSFAVDATGAKAPDDPELLARLRVKLSFDSAEHWAAFGIQGAAGTELQQSHAFGPTLPGDRLPGAQTPLDQAYQPTEGWLGATLGKAATVRAGLMGSHWGLGLLANDGAIDQTSSNWFVVPRLGDRVTRAALVLTPWRGTDSPLRGLVVSAAMDQVYADDVLLPGDTARQMVGAVKLYTAPDQWFGLYVAKRDQHNLADRGINVTAIDAAADYALTPKWGSLRLQAEAAMVMGTTTLGATPDHVSHDVQQGAAMARATAKTEAGMQAQLDVAWMSGDKTLEDGKVTAFRADPNLQFGLILFPRVLAYQSGRARLRASDPQLIGTPAEDLDRLATGGSISSAVLLYPKVGQAFADHGEVYGGVLLALAPSPLADPRSSRTAGGGQPFNYLGNAPDGLALGTEINFGVRGTWMLPEIGRTMLGVEGATLMPGGVLNGLSGPIYAGRVVLEVRNVR